MFMRYIGSLTMFVILNMPCDGAAGKQNTCIPLRLQPGGVPAVGYPVVGLFLGDSCDKNQLSKVDIPSATRASSTFEEGNSVLQTLSGEKIYEAIRLVKEEHHRATSCIVGKSSSRTKITLIYDYPCLLPVCYLQANKQATVIMGTILHVITGH